MSGRDENPETLLEDYRRFIRLRHDHDALKTGTIRILEAAADVLAFERRSAAETIICVFNFALEPAGWQLPAGSAAQVLAASRATLSGTAITLQGNGAIYLNVTEQGT